MLECGRSRIRKKTNLADIKSWLGSEHRHSGPRPESENKTGKSCLFLGIIFALLFTFWIRM